VDLDLIRSIAGFGVAVFGTPQKFRDTGCAKVVITIVARKSVDFF
jgi:hypothetical protein